MLYSADSNTNDSYNDDSRLEGDDGSREVETSFDWLQLARDCYENSEDWFDAAIRKDIERNIAHFQNRHAPGSKYYSELYKHRAKGFRPKTRAVINKNEALAATAYFATSGILNIKPEDPSDTTQRASAEINREILEYRLENTIPWYKVLLGAYQETMVNKVCISHQYWDYREAVRLVPEYDDMGNEVLDEDGQISMKEEVVVIKDSPAIDLRPVENVRFSPAANWLDPVNSSPFIIDLIPMDVDSAISMIREGGKSRIKWYDISAEQLLAAGRSRREDDSTQTQRAPGNYDPQTEVKFTNQLYDTIWIHRNIMRKDGRDWVYYTAGTSELLCDPIPLEEEYPHLKIGQRPYTLGTSALEAHKVYVQSLADVTADSQRQVNEITNQRLDNVSLVLNRRYYVRRGQNVDLKALTRNVPGGVVLTNNIDQDVRSEAPPDVTSSSYAEQDRLNMDFDDVAGNFSVSSVANNRQLNETVGGMELMSGDADTVSEYRLRTFNETWVVPVLKQLIQLEQRHETDEAIFRMVGNKISMWDRYGVGRVEDYMLQGSMKVEVNVGFGATNPSQRLTRITTAVTAAKSLAPQLMSRLDEEEVVKEIFGSIGFKDGTRFIVPEVPEEEQPTPPEDPNITLERLRGQNRMELEQVRFDNNWRIEEFRSQNDMRKEDVELEKSMAELAQKMEIEERRMETEQASAEQKREMDRLKQRAKLIEKAIKERNENARQKAELDIKRQTGQGI